MTTNTDTKKEIRIDRANYLEGKALRIVLMKRYEGRCYWCDIKVRDDYECLNRGLRKHEYLPHDTATIDHLDYGNKGIRNPDPTGVHKVLACYRCNISRGKKNEKIRKLIQRTNLAWIKKIEMLKHDIEYGFILENIKHGDAYMKGAWINYEDTIKRLDAVLEHGR